MEISKSGIAKAEGDFTKMVNAANKKVVKPEKITEAEIIEMINMCTSLNDLMMSMISIPSIDNKQVRINIFSKWTFGEICFLVQCGILFGLNWKGRLEGQNATNSEVYKKLTAMAIPVKNSAGDEAVITLPRIVLGCVDLVILTRANMRKPPCIIPEERIRDYTDAGLPLAFMQLGIADGIPKGYQSLYTSWCQEAGWYLSKKKENLKAYKQTHKVITKNIGRGLNVADGSQIAGKFSSVVGAKSAFKSVTEYFEFAPDLKALKNTSVDALWKAQKLKYDAEFTPEAK